MKNTEETDATPARGQETFDPDIAKAQSSANERLGCDHRDLVPILAFVRQEVDESAAILRDLAERLSQALHALATTADRNVVQSSLFAATTALQNEDRVQQRLSDLGAALSVVERALIVGSPATGADLDRTVIDSLRLEETRGAFAINAGMADALAQPSNEPETPTVGDIDLF